MNSLIKYPRTVHLEGSGLQKGDSDQRLLFASLKNKYVVFEEKLDGANCGFDFDDDYNLRAQSRGHYLDLNDRGGRERHFNLLKDWLKAHESRFLDRFEDRYLVFGEWLYAAHTVYYDMLPHYFMEFDIWDKKNGAYLDTISRKKLISGLPIVQVPVLYEGVFTSEKEVLRLIQPSLYKSQNWLETLKTTLTQDGLDLERNLLHIEHSDVAEGLYGKIESDNSVEQRFKYVRSNFTQTIIDNDSHWHSRPIIRNSLRKDVNIFGDSND